MIQSRYLGLLILTAINAANYIDRYVAAAVMPLIQTEFHLTNTELGMLGTAFMVVYTIAAPLLGFLGDRVARKYVIAGSVVLWSIATGMGAWCSSFMALLVARACVGIGEAGYGSACPSWVADLFPASRRGSALAFFYMALPLGTAAGYKLGGEIGASSGWRHAFQMVGFPGILLAIFVLMLQEPERGAMDREEGAKPVHHDPPTAQDYKQLLQNPAYLAISAGMAAMTFVMGGLALFAPLYLVNIKHMPLAEASGKFGLTTAVAGLVGTSLGGVLGDAVSARFKGGHLLVSGIGMILAAPAAIIGLAQNDPNWLFGLLFVAEVLMFLNQGPLNAAIANVTTPKVRTVAFSLNIFLIHILGDIPSPYLIGKIADSYSLTAAMQAAALLSAGAGLVMLCGVGVIRSMKTTE